HHRRPAHRARRTRVRAGAIRFPGRGGGSGVTQPAKKRHHPWNLIMNYLFMFLLALLLGRVWASFKVRHIHACDRSLYMTRIELWRFRNEAKLMLNYFHRSDEDRELHDHPWQFWSFIILRGYIEHHPGGTIITRPLQLIHRA